MPFVFQGPDTPAKMSTCTMGVVNKKGKNIFLPLCWRVIWMEFEDMHFRLNIVTNSLYSLVE